MFLKPGQSDLIFLYEKEHSYSYDVLQQKMAELSFQLKAFNEKKAFLLEAENNFQTYVRFLTLLQEGHTVLLCSPWQFKDESFIRFLKAQTQTDFILWNNNAEVSDLKGSGASDHPMVKHDLEKGHARFLVRTSGSSGKKYKFILHDPFLFVKKYQKIGPHFEKTFAFSPAESIAGIETLLETVFHEKELVCAGDRLSPAQIIDLLSIHQVDYFQTTPTFLNLLVMSGQIDPQKLATLKKIAFGSEPSQKNVLHHIQSKLPHIKFMHTYGMSEIGIQRTITNIEDATTFLLDDKFNPAKLNKDLMEVKSLTPMLGYLNESRIQFDEGWFRTLDKVERHNNFWKVLGRDSDLINLAGRKFYPSEVEELFMQMEEVLDVTIQKEPNELIGNILVCSITIGKEQDEREFRLKFKAFCANRIPYYMHPHKVNLTKEISVSSRYKKMRVL